MKTDLGQNEQKQIDQLRQTLDVAGIRYNILAHDITVVSADEGAKRGIGSLREMAPTFILKTEKGYLAAIISGESRLLYKKIKKQLGLKDVSLATPEQVEQATRAQIGSVSLVNVGLPTIIDSRLVGMEFVYGGCGICCHTLQIKVADLIELTKARVFEFTELKKR